MRATIRRTVAAGILRVKRTPITAPAIDDSAITAARGQATPVPSAPPTGNHEAAVAWPARLWLSGGRF